MPRTKSNSIEAMGLENFINMNFAYLEDKFGMKPYRKLDLLFRAAAGDTAIADEFSTEHRQIVYQTVGHWRRFYVQEGEK